MELGLPCPQRVVQLPEIAWDQYTSGRSEFERDFCDKKCKTRRLKLIFDKGIRIQYEHAEFNACSFLLGHFRQSVSNEVVTEIFHLWYILDVGYLFHVNKNSV